MKGHVPTPAAAVDVMVGKMFGKRRPKANDVLVDPGCGDGAFLQGVLRHCAKNRLPVPKLVGVELHPERAAAARRNLGKKARILNQDFLTNEVPPADYIIGNPPYVSLPSLDVAERATYREAFSTAVGRFDLYLLFFERSLGLLKAGGVLTFVTPEKYQYVDAAGPLRDLLVKRGVDELHFQDANLFPGRVTYPVITTVGGAKVTRILGRGRVRSVKLPAGGSSWNGALNGAPPQAGEPTLDSIALRISPGIASGCEDAFVVRKGQVEERLLRHAHPTVSGRQLLAVGPKTNEYLICPYDDDGRLREEHEIRDVIEYLGLHRRRLEERSCVTGGRAWYQYHDTFPGRAIMQPKILCKDITQEPKFWMDHDGTILPRHSVYYIVPKAGVDINRLFAYLNGERATKWLKDHSQRAARGYYRLQSSVLRNLPVPEDLVP